MNALREFLEFPGWAQTLIAVGLLALGTVLITLFSALGRRPRRLWVTDPLTVGEPAFLLTLAGAVGVPLRAGGTATLLDNGAEFVPGILSAIRGARHHVHFMVYIFKRGLFAEQVMEALTERAREGVEVRLLLDTFGSLNAPRPELDALQAAGGHVIWFRPPVLGKLMRMHRRNHRRAIVIDGRIGFTGGASVDDVWLGEAQGPEYWRDSMVRVTGPMASSLQSAFTELWAYASGEVVTGPEYYPLDEHPLDLATAAQHVNLVSSPASEEHPLRLFFLLSFVAARERLWITTAYFVPDKQLRNALADRAQAGVDVRLLLPGRHIDAKPVRWAAQTYYDELLAAGVRIFEYQPTFLHVKTLVADGRWSVVGSANLDIRSKELAEENVLGILDAEFAQQLERSFERDLEKANEIRLDGWRRRALPGRLAERASALFVEQY